MFLILLNVFLTCFSLYFHNSFVKKDKSFRRLEIGPNHTKGKTKNGKMTRICLVSPESHSQSPSFRRWGCD